MSPRAIRAGADVSRGSGWRPPARPPAVLMHSPPLVPTGVSSAEARRPRKSSHFSVNWVAGHADVEILDATTGKRSCGGWSRLCKHVLSARWARLYGKVGDGASAGSQRATKAKGPQKAVGSAARGTRDTRAAAGSVSFSPTPRRPSGWGRGYYCDTWCGQHRTPQESLHKALQVGVIPSADLRKLTLREGR